MGQGSLVTGALHGTASSGVAGELVLALRAALAGREVALGWCEPARASVEWLSPIEREGVAPARLIEVAAGRAAARAALRRAGLSPVEIGRDALGAPRWPRGVVGSITHTGTLALAAVARSSALSAIGVDLERVRALDPAALDAIASRTERARIAAAADPEQEAIAIFSAKEAFYKAQYPLTLCVLDFDAVEIAVEPRAAQRPVRRFVATFRVDAPPFERRSVLRGALVHAGEHVVAAVAAAA